jgi:hypothetical protein
VSPLTSRTESAEGGAPATLPRSTRLRIVAALQLGGGILGLLAISSSTFADGLGLSQRLIIGMASIPFALAVYAGRRLWNWHPSALAPSLLVQSLQLLWWSSPAWSYSFSTGFLVGGWLGPTVLEPLIHVGSQFDLQVSADPTRAEALGINLLAAWAIQQLLQTLIAHRGQAAPPQSPEVIIA